MAGSDWVLLRRALCAPPRLGARFDRVHDGCHVGLTVTQLNGLGVQIKADIQQRRREIRIASRLFFSTSTIEACTVKSSFTSLSTFTRDTLLAIGPASSTA